MCVFACTTHNKDFYVSLLKEGEKTNKKQNKTNKKTQKISVSVTCDCFQGDGII